MFIWTDWTAGSEFVNKNSFAKKSDHSKENSLLQAKHFLGFVKGFSESVKGIYETCNCNFFNLAIIIVFPTLQFMLYYILLEPLAKTCEKQ